MHRTPEVANGILPARSAATAAITTTAAATASLCPRSGFVNGERPAADLFAIRGFDSRSHVLLRDLDECESLVADDSDFRYRTMRLE